MFMCFMLMFVDWLNYVASYDVLFHFKGIPFLSLKYKMPFVRSPYYNKKDIQLELTSLNSISFGYNTL